MNLPIVSGFLPIGVGIAEFLCDGGRLFARKAGGKDFLCKATAHSLLNRLKPLKSD